MPYAYIGFGSNVNDRLVHINQALQRLSGVESVLLMQVSSIYETQPVGYDEQNWFLNGVVAVETTLAPQHLLDSLKRVEEQVGRQNRIRWGPREIDLDLLIYDQLRINGPSLTIPHPEMHQRRFVLAPFAEIAPDTIHPNRQETIQTLLCQLTDEKVVQLVAPPTLKGEKDRIDAT